MVLTFSYAMVCPIGHGIERVKTISWFPDFFIPPGSPGLQKKIMMV